MRRQQTRLQVNDGWSKMKKLFLLIITEKNSIFHCLREQIFVRSFNSFQLVETFMLLLYFNNDRLHLSSENTTIYIIDQFKNLDRYSLKVEDFRTWSHKTNNHFFKQFC